MPPNLPDPCDKAATVAVEAMSPRHPERLWSPPYVAASAGAAPLEILKPYIRQ
jgi:hypothetical protein